MCGFRCASALASIHAGLSLFHRNCVSRSSATARSHITSAGCPRRSWASCARLFPTASGRAAERSTKMRSSAGGGSVEPCFESVFGWSSPPLPRLVEEADLVLPLRALARTEAHALHDDGKPGATGEHDQPFAVLGVVARSEERRVGKEC